MPRLPVTLTAGEHERLRERAKAMRVTMSALLRTAALGPRPGDPAAAADTWWELLPPGRRAQIHRFLGAPDQPDPPPGTTPLPFGP